MDEGTPQGSPCRRLSGYVIYIANTLNKAQNQIGKIEWAPTRRSSRFTKAPSRPKSFQVGLFSYADDVKPLVISEGTTAMERKWLCKQVDKILEEAATQEHLNWGPGKESSVTFSDQGPLESTITLGILINSRFNFQPHVNARTEKAQRLLAVMVRLAKTNGGLPPGALRSLLTGALRPTFTWGRTMEPGGHGDELVRDATPGIPITQEDNRGVPRGKPPEAGMDRFSGAPPI